MPVERPWSENPQGWSAFVSDLQLGTPQEIRTPRGEQINLRDPKWQPQYDNEGDLIEWRQYLPSGKQVVIFND